MHTIKNLRNFESYRIDQGEFLLARDELAILASKTPPAETKGESKGEDFEINLDPPNWVSCKPSGSDHFVLSVSEAKGESFGWIAEKGTVFLPPIISLVAMDTVIQCKEGLAVCVTSKHWLFFERP